MSPQEAEVCFSLMKKIYISIVAKTAIFLKKRKIFYSRNK